MVDAGDALYVPDGGDCVIALGGACACVGGGFGCEYAGCDGANDETCGADGLKPDGDCVICGDCVKEDRLLAEELWKELWICGACCVGPNVGCF